MLFITNTHNTFTHTIPAHAQKEKGLRAQKSLNSQTLDSTM